MIIEHSKTDDGQHRIRIESDRLECDAMIFVFTDEGLIIDAVTGGVVEGSSSQMYDEIEEGLIPS
jgi:hypothetical protein